MRIQLRAAAAIVISACALGYHEQHLQAQQGSALVYVYQYLPGPGDPSPAAGTGSGLDEPRGRGFVMLPNFGRTGLFVYLNGKRAADFSFGRYTVFEVEPGPIGIEVRPPEDAPQVGAAAAQIPMVSFVAEAGETYYVWGNFGYWFSADRRQHRTWFSLSQTSPEIATKHLKKLEEQASYL